MGVHRCRQSEDPRHVGRCACGKVLAKPEPRRRNLGFERDITHHVARGVADPTKLIEHAEIRASKLSGEYVTDPMLVAADRDRVLDVREELVDARNHLVWWLEDHLDDETVPNKEMALRNICVAYELLREG